MAKKAWQRNRALEDRAKRNFVYRSGVLFGVLFTWIVVGTGTATFVEVAVVMTTFVVLFTSWELWKMWKGV